MPKISVIVPVYNCEKYLPACFESLLNQTFRDIEMICVDDGSTDTSYAILQQYAKKDHRIKVYQQQNSGVASARNFALDKATGDWIAFCDSDDTVPLDAYEKLYKMAKECDIVVGDFYDIDDYGAQDRALPKPVKQMSAFAALFKVPCVWTKLMNKQFIENNKLRFPELRLGEDVVFLATAAVCNPKVTVINNAVYYHWNHNKEYVKSLNHQYDFAHFQMHIKCREELLRICYREAGMKEAYYYVFHNMESFLIDYLFRIQEFEDKQKAFETLKKHFNDYNWSDELQRFECLMGIPYNEFQHISAEQYFTTTKLMNPEELVLKRYAAGMMGFRYILKYIKAWAGYKIKRFKLEQKK